MHPTKACAVVLSADPTPRILLFRHPVAGVQLVKGGIEPGETPGAAALRELAEESGITAATLEADLGLWASGHREQVWSFHLCRVSGPLAEQWSHQTLDDHGHCFDFFWAPLDQLPLADCDPLFQRALEFVGKALKARPAIRLERAIPILRMFDETKAREFYLDFLGFEVEFEHRFEAALPLYLGIRRNGLQLHLSEHHGDASPGTTLFVPVQGIESLRDELRNKRYGYARPDIVEQGWGKVLEVHDPFGNRIRFCEG